jgi:hypothetical protein
MKRIVEESKKKRVLIVVTNHETLGKTSYPAGLWLSELTHPYFELADHGIEVDIASPKGDKAPIDPYSDPRSPNIAEIANTEKNLPLTVVQLDVNDDRSVKAAISKIVAEKGRIDILEGLSESIRYELKEWDNNIVVIEPGVIKTNFVENSGSAHTTLKSESPYADLIGRTMKGFRVLMDNSSSSPKLVAEAILNAITSKEPEIRFWLVTMPILAARRIRRRWRGREALVPPPLTRPKSQSNRTS